MEDSDVDMAESNQKQASNKAADSASYKNRAQIKNDGVVNVSFQTL
jgi:hypothetical protein